VKPQRDWLLAVIAAEPDITLMALSVRLQAERGVRADTSMLSRFFIGEGISFKKKRAAVRTGSA
jgi:transposase